MVIATATVTVTAVVVGGVTYHKVRLHTESKKVKTLEARFRRNLERLLKKQVLISNRLGLKILATEKHIENMISVHEGLNRRQRKKAWEIAKKAFDKKIKSLPTFKEFVNEDATVTVKWVGALIDNAATGANPKRKK